MGKTPFMVKSFTVAELGNILQVLWDTAGFTLILFAGLYKPSTKRIRCNGFLMLLLIHTDEVKLLIHT
jgi:hypothetical protein